MPYGTVNFMAQRKRKNTPSKRNESTKLRDAQTGQFVTVTYQSVRDISTRFNLRSADVDNLFGIAKRTQARYKKENPVLKPDTADRLARFNRIFKQAVDLFEDEAEATHWLNTPKSALDGETPLSALATDAGAKKVEQILYRAEYGMFG
jgi:putative toxin-antitoxin system antitoxin component (TIGR02293 family)